jgi:type II secretory pathway pseudopilin PulG
MVIVIIGLLAAVVVPKYTDIRTQAQAAAEAGTVAAVRSGIKLARLTYLSKGADSQPASLDSAAVGPASDTNPLFTNVIEDGVTDPNWEKISTIIYRYTPTGRRYAYNGLTGKFTVTVSPPPPVSPVQ